MFVGSIGLGVTGFELIIIPLKGTSMKGGWGKNTDLLLLCHFQSGRFCVCSPSPHYSRFVDKLGMPEVDAKNLANWVKENFESNKQ